MKKRIFWYPVYLIWGKKVSSLKMDNEYLLFENLKDQKRKKLLNISKNYF
jgi:hypothetical protein